MSAANSAASSSNSEALVPSIQPLRPSAAVVSLAALDGVTNSRWIPIKGDIHPRVGDEIVSGRGLSATEGSIKPLHLEFFLPR